PQASPGATPPLHDALPLSIREEMGLAGAFNSATRTVQLTTPERSAAQQGATSSSGYITAERAKEIALADAGVKAADAVFLRATRSEEHTSELQSRCDLVCR